jgi:O-antigen ligase
VGLERFLVRASRNAVVAIYLLFQFVPPLLPLLSGRLDASSILNDSAANPVWQLIVGFVFLNSLLFAVLFRVSVRRIVWICLPMIPMIVWIAASYAWSAYPDLTIRRGARLIIELLSVTILGLSFESRKDLLRTLYWTFLFVNMLDICSLAVPSFSFNSNGFAGIHLNKNLTGLFFFVALPVFALAIYDRSISYVRTVAYFAFASAAAMLVITFSKSAIGIVCIASIVALISKIGVSRDARVRFTIAIGAIGLAAIMALIVYEIGISDIFNVLFGDATLTGRDQIWRYALYKFEQREWLGTGYGALWQVGADVETSLKDIGARWVANQAHDGYIDVLAQLGIPGMMCLAVFLVTTFFRLQSCMSAPLLSLNGYAMYLFWGALIYNITESSYFRVGHGLWTMLMLVLPVVFSSAVGRARARS